MAIPSTLPLPQSNAEAAAQNSENFLSSTPLGFITETALVSTLMGCLTPIGVIGGLYFGFSGNVAARLTDRVCDKLGCTPDTTAGKVARLALPALSYVAAGCITLTIAGIAWTPGIIAGLVGGTFLFHQLLIARGDAKLL